jgi:CHASE3 domain sensor protein
MAYLILLFLVVLGFVSYQDNQKSETSNTGERTVDGWVLASVH